VRRQSYVYQVKMPRPAKYDESSILKAAATIVASRGPSAATIAAISHAIGAPSGSIYHRFPTRDELLGRLWLNKAAFFQDRWTTALNKPDAEEAGLAAALSLPRTVREDFKGARIMLLHRREDFLSDTWPAEMQAEAQRLGEQVQDSLAQITRRLFGRNSAFARQVATFAVLDLPFSAVRRFVAMGRMPPPAIDDLVTTAHKAVISQHRSQR
jgi:AcrR family transcriptional regulator